MKLEDNRNVVKIDRDFYGTEISFRSGNKHRHHSNGPAWIHCSGRKEYHNNGWLHNTKGVAIWYRGDVSYYYFNGSRLSKEEWEYDTRG